MNNKVEEVVLKNGLKIIFIFDDAFSTSSIQMSFPVGWRNDPMGKVGLAHLFEHLVGKRTYKFRQKSELVKTLEEAGIRYDAVTSPNITSYFHKQTTENLKLSLGLMFEAIYNSIFNEEDLIKEKQVVLTEARQYMDNDTNFSWHLTAKNLFKNTTLSNFFFGDEESLGNISIGDFEKYYQIFRNPKNSTLFISTSTINSKDAIVEFIESLYEKTIQTSDIQVLSVNDSFRRIEDRNLKFLKENKAQSTLSLGYRHEKLNIHEVVAFRILQAILVNGFSGKIKSRLRDELNLVYMISFSQMNFNDVGMSYFLTNCKKDKTEQVVNEIKLEIQKIHETISQEDVNKVINISLFNLAEHKTSFSELSFISKNFFNLNEFINNSEYINILREIKAEDIKKLMQKIFIEENSTVCIIG